MYATDYFLRALLIQLFKTNFKAALILRFWHEIMV